MLDFNISNVRPKKRAAAQITIVSSQACSQPDLLALLCRQYTTHVLVAAALQYIPITMNLVLYLSITDHSVKARWLCEQGPLPDS